MRSGWHICMFHYCNQGAYYGRIRVGLQVPPKNGKAFDRSLKKLGYPYAEETDNPVYRLFLRA
jgi:threonine dehydratase